MSRQFKISSCDLPDQQEPPHMQTMNDEGDIQLIEMEMFSQNERDRYELDEEDGPESTEKPFNLEDSQRIKLMPNVRVHETDSFEPKPVGLQIKSVL